jgi:predicted transcriptional regulator
MTDFTVNLPDDIIDQLDQLARKLNRSRSDIVAQAITEYVERETWGIADIEAGIAEADRGEFASDDEINRIFAKYVKPK